MSSCKSMQRLTAKDDSASKRNVVYTKSETKPVFIEQISVTPGGVNAKKQYASNSNKPALQSSITTYATVSSGIESANWLQVKYSIITDINVEQLNDIALLSNIEKWWGTRYCMGGTGDYCIDCSAFTQTMMQNVYNVNIPRTAQEQYAATDRVSYMDLRQGDLVFFHTTGRIISHVGLYLGNNKFVHASTSSGVMISDLTDSYWSGKFMGGGRIKE